MYFLPYRTYMYSMYEPFPYIELLSTSSSFFIFFYLSSVFLLKNSYLQFVMDFCHLLSSPRSCWALAFSLQDLFAMLRVGDLGRRRRARARASRRRTRSSFAFSSMYAFSHSLRFNSSWAPALSSGCHRLLISFLLYFVSRGGFLSPSIPS